MSKKKQKVRALVYGGGTFLLLLFLWEITVRMSDSQIPFPTPLAVIERFVDMLFHNVGYYYRTCALESEPCAGRVLYRCGVRYRAGADYGMVFLCTCHFYANL